MGSVIIRAKAERNANDTSVAAHRSARVNGDLSSIADDGNAALHGQKRKVIRWCASEQAVGSDDVGAVQGAG